MKKHHAPARPPAARLLAPLALAPLIGLAQAAFDWTGATDGVWGDASNWSPSAGAPPGSAATDTARFNATVAHSAVTLGSAATIRQLRFESGAGEYVVGGERLTISYGSSQPFVVHQAGNIQTIQASLELVSTGGFRDISVATGGTLVVSEKLVASGGTDKHVRVSGGGVLDIMSGFTGANGLYVGGAGTTLNLHGGGGVNRLRAEDGARINLHVGHGGDFTLAGAGSSIHLRFDGVAAATGGAQSINIAPAAGQAVTLGADIVGGGTGSFGRELRLFQAGTVNDAAVRLVATAGSVLNLNGRIVDTNAAGSGSRVEIGGGGVVRFSGTTANTSTTPIQIADGTLELAKTEGVAAIGGGAVTLGSSGALRLAASHQIADATSIVFSGGLLDVGAFGESLGSLSVGADGGVIDFGGEAGSLAFSGLSSIVGTLVVSGWTAGASITFADGSGWDAETLSRVSFIGHGEALFDEVAGRLHAAPIPEPAGAAVWAATCALGLAGIHRRRGHARHPAFSR